MMKTTIYAKPHEEAANRKWYIVDATDLVLGRMATEIAKILRGKHKPNYTPSTDCGDNIIVINAEKVHITGKKASDKKFFWHTGFPGGIKETTPKERLRDGKANRTIEKAVQRMISRETPHGRAQFSKLFVYNGETHPHTAQQPVKLDLANKNPKNRKVR
jgi:large subunit ribosomal protein L13